MSAPYDYEALWLKAKLFLNHAMDNPEIRSFSERALWSSLALEALAKAALARQSPLLIAVPAEDGTNVLIALGLISGEARFESIPAKSLYSRCEKAFRPFSKEEALKTARARNEYVHGAAAEFTRLPESAWWPKYWSQASILISACEKNLDDLVGPQRAIVVQQFLEKNTKHMEHRYKMLIDRARQRRAQFKAGTLPARIARDWQPGVAATAGLSYQQEQRCPACGASGVLEGDNKIDVQEEYERIDEDDYDYFITLTVSSDYFSCGDCGLVLDEYQLIEEADIADTFEVNGDVEDIEHRGWYGND
ncbi:hypothetical protein [Dietzia maris]|uniref:hypothetical protein n=1 Tax=Dietzia maris TaxID=37915 RepID=UPI0037C913B1